MSIPAVLHPDIIEFLRQQTEGYFNAKVWECIQKLKQQQFDGGLRVKKLNGINKRVWEARINSASRLIFTYNKSRQPETGKARVYLAIQDICVDHDDVSRRAKARQRTPDTEWLSAEDVEIILETKNFALHPASTIEIEGFSSVISDEEKLEIEAIKAVDFEVSSDGTDELIGNIQWQVLESELEWQKAIVRQDADLPLKLTPEEYQLAKFSGNLLLSGNAGTGKTTVALYRLLQRDTAPGKRLYVACNPLLVNSAREQFERLVVESNFDGRGVKGDRDIKTIFEFKTMRELCLEILNVSGESYSKELEVNFHFFAEMYRAHPQRKQYPTYLVWDEIRSIIKGKQLSLNEDILSQKEYDRIGKNYSRLGLQKQRFELYKLALWYQGKLKKMGGFDEIDLVRKARQIIKDSPREFYQSIVCDEVQDLTELQLELLFDYIALEGNLLFAGDVYQTINPSGFRWQELKQKFYPDREVEEKTLEFNFRSVGSLVNLANQLLKLREKLLQEPRSDRSITNGSYGQLARAISATPEMLNATLKETSLYPGDAILVRTETDKEKFRKELDSSFVFTIEEAKGLEFDTVFLVDFFQVSEKLWNKVLRGGLLKDKEKPQLQLELNLLYVAITRASRILNVWESKLCKIWETEELAGLLQSIIPEIVRSDRVEPSSEVWQKQGLYYLKAEFYQQARECFTKSGDVFLEKQARAKCLIQKQQYNQAGEIFMELEAWEDAARLWEKIRCWEKAGKCWQKAEDRDRQKICQIYSLEASRKWSEAAQKWEALERFEDAKRCWMNIPEKKAQYRAAEFEAKQQWHKAAAEYELAKLPLKAALCRGKNLERKKQWQQAVEQYRLAGELKIAQECAKRGGEYLYARGLAKLQQKDSRGALKDYDLALKLDPHNVLFYNNRGIAKAQIGYLKEAIADLNISLKINPQDAQSYHNLAASYAEMGDFQQALNNFLESAKYKPDDPQTYYNLGVVRFKLDDKEGALADYTRSLELKPDRAETYYNRGIILRVQGDNLAALADFNEVVRLNPNIVDTYIKRGVVRFDLKDTQGAIEDLNQAIQLNPKNPEALYNRAIIRRFLKDNQGAVADFNQVVNFNPNYVDAYIKRGVIRFDLGDRSGAIEDFDRAIKLNPKNPEGYYHRGNIRRTLEQYENAAVDFRSALRLNPRYYQAYNDFGILCLTIGELRLAIDHFERALIINPHYAEGYNNRGFTRFRLGEVDGAMSDLQEALRINPNYIEAYNNRGNARIKIGDYQGAINDFSETIRVHPKYVAAYNNRGFARLKFGDPQGAIADCQECLRINPNYGMAYYNLGLIHTEMGKLTEALEYFDRTLQIHPQKPDVYINRGWVRWQLGNYSEAIADETKAININPKLGTPFYFRGQIKRELGLFADAIADIEKAAEIYEQQKMPEDRQRAVDALDAIELQMEKNGVAQGRDRGDMADMADMADINANSQESASIIP